MNRRSYRVWGCRKRSFVVRNLLQAFARYQRFSLRQLFSLIFILLCLAPSFVHANSCIDLFRLEGSSAQNKYIDVLHSESTMLETAVGRKVKFTMNGKIMSGTLKSYRFGEYNFNFVPPAAEVFVTVVNQAGEIILNDVLLQNQPHFMIQIPTTKFTGEVVESWPINLVRREFYSLHKAFDFKALAVAHLDQAVLTDTRQSWQTFHPADVVKDTVGAPDMNVVENFKVLIGRKIIGVQNQSSPGTKYAQNEVISFGGKIIKIFNVSKQPGQWPYWIIKVQGPQGIILISASGPNFSKDKFYIEN